MKSSRQYDRIEESLGEPLAGLITTRRREGVSWRRIALEVTGRTHIDVTGETLRVWHCGVAPIVSARS